MSIPAFYQKRSMCIWMKQGFLLTQEPVSCLPFKGKDVWNKAWDSVELCAKPGLYSVVASVLLAACHGTCPAMIAWQRYQKWPSGTNGFVACHSSLTNWLLTCFVCHPGLYFQPWTRAWKSGPSESGSCFFGMSFMHWVSSLFGPAFACHIFAFGLEA